MKKIYVSLLLIGILILHGNFILTVEIQPHIIGTLGWEKDTRINPYRHARTYHPKFIPFRSIDPGSLLLGKIKVPENLSYRLENIGVVIEPSPQGIEAQTLTKETLSFWFLTQKYKQKFSIIPVTGKEFNPSIDIWIETGATPFLKFQFKPAIGNVITSQLNTYALEHYLKKFFTQKDLKAGTFGDDFFIADNHFIEVLVNLSISAENVTIESLTVNYFKQGEIKQTVEISGKDLKKAQVIQIAGVEAKTEADGESTVAPEGTSEETETGFTFE